MKVPIENASKVFRTYADVMPHDEFITNKDSRAFVIIGHVEDGCSKPDVSIWLNGYVDIHSNLSLFNIWGSTDLRFCERVMLSVLHIAKYISNNTIDRLSYVSITDMLHDELSKHIPDFIIHYECNMDNIDHKFIPIRKGKCDKNAFEQMIDSGNRWKPVVLAEMTHKKLFYIFPYGGIILYDKYASIEFEDFIELLTLADIVTKCSATCSRYGRMISDKYFEKIVNLISE